VRKLKVNQQKIKSILGGIQTIMKHKFSSMGRVAIALVLALSLSLVMAVPVSADVSQATVAVDNAAPTASTTYTIDFTTTVALEADTDSITVEFPEGTTTLPGTVTVDGTSATALASGMRVKVTVPADTPAGDVALIFTGITNPAADGYTLDIYTSQEQNAVESVPYTINNTAVGEFDVVIDPDTTGSVAAYTLGGSTKLIGGGLVAGEDTITVIFHEDNVVPASITPGTVFVNGNAVTDTIVIVGQYVTITVPEDVISDGGNLTVVFSAGTGITNPEEPASDYTLEAYTSDGARATSGTYTVVLDVIAQLVFTVSPLGVSQSVASALITVQAQDACGNEVSIGGISPDDDVTIDLESTSVTGVFDDDSAFVTPTTSVTMAGDAGIATFYYKDATTGTFTITATASGETWTPATFDIAVNPKVELYDGALLIDDTFDTIQLAIDAALPGDTVKVGAGIYEEELRIVTADLTIESTDGAASTTIYNAGYFVCEIVTVDGVTIDGFTFENSGYTGGDNRGIFVRGASGFTIQNNEFIESNSDGIVVISESGAVTSGVIGSNTFTGTGVYSGYGRSGINVESAGYDISGVEITNNTLSAYSGDETNAIGVAQTTGAVSEITVQDNTISDSYRGISLCGDVTGLTGDYAISNNTITGCKAGFKASWGGGVEFDLVYNSITGNTHYGVWLHDATLSAETVTIKYNDLSGNGEWGIYNVWVDTGTDVVATHNYWGDVTGPSAGTGDYASTAAGSGDAVSVEATYSPWLHKSYEDVVDDNADYPALSVPLSTGWNTLSTPAKLISTADSVDELVPTGLSLAYWYDAFNEDGPIWRSAVTRQLLPCDAVYIKMVSTQTVLFQIDGTATYVPSKDLAAGWNLIGLADLADMQEEDAIASVYGSYAQLVSPSMNTAEWIFVTEGTPAFDMVVGEGYWIFMKSDATLGGFVLCPIVPAY